MGAGRWAVSAPLGGAGAGCLRRPRTPNAHLPRRGFLFTARRGCRSDFCGSTAMSYLFDEHRHVGTGREVEAKGFPVSVLALKSFQYRFLKTLSLLHRLALARLSTIGRLLVWWGVAACPRLGAHVGCRLPPPAPQPPAPRQQRAPTPGRAFPPLALFQGCSRHLGTHAPPYKF